MGTRLTIPISGPRPSPKENCTPSCRKKYGMVTLHSGRIKLLTDSNISALRNLLSLSLRPWWNLLSRILSLPTSTIQWDQLLFLNSRLADRTGRGRLPGLHPLARKPIINKPWGTEQLYSYTYSMNARPALHKRKMMQEEDA